MTKNEIKYLRDLHKKKFRDEEKKFLVEGNHLIEELLNSQFYSGSIEKIFISDSFNYPTLLSEIEEKDIEMVRIGNSALSKISETETSQGIIALVSKPAIPSQNSETLVLALDNIQDPGNLGTIIRTSRWFNVDKIILSKNSVDMYNSKVIRAAQGAMFDIIIEEGKELDKDIDKYHTEGYDIYITDLNTERLLSGERFKNKTVFVFGNESRGVKSLLSINPHYKKIKIDSFSSFESLNVAISTGIVLYVYKTSLK